MSEDYDEDVGSTGQATDDELKALHGVFARHLVKRIRGGEVTAAELREAREFLKDNKVQSVPTAGSALKSLADMLPFPDRIDAGLQ